MKAKKKKRSKKNTQFFWDSKYGAVFRLGLPPAIPIYPLPAPLLRSNYNFKVYGLCVFFFRPQALIPLPQAFGRLLRWMLYLIEMMKMVRPRHISGGPQPSRVPISLVIASPCWTHTTQLPSHPATQPPTPIDMASPTSPHSTF